MGPCVTCSVQPDAKDIINIPFIIDGVVFEGVIDFLVFVEAKGKNGV
jgi:hypothetical protein